MKKLLLLAILSLSLAAKAQTILPQPALDAFHFLAQGSNWMIAPYGIINDKGDKFGGGIAAAYKINDFLAPVLRLDYYNGKVWMPSMSLNLQAPINLTTNISLVPFAFSGIATPIAGKGNSDGTAVGIFGAGAALKIGKHWDLLWDMEKWSGFDGVQHRVGFGYKF